MTIEFKTIQEDRVILITATGDISTDELNAMRNKTIDLLNKTGIQDFVVDLSEVTSILKQDVLKAYKKGKEFDSLQFPVTAKTAVILPLNKEAKEQVTFMHTVEINRMRGPIKYVASYEEAISWFG